MCIFWDVCQKLIWTKFSKPSRHTSISDLRAMNFMEKMCYCCGYFVFPNFTFDLEKWATFVKAKMKLHFDKYALTCSNKTAWNVMSKIVVNSIPVIFIMSFLYVPIFICVRNIVSKYFCILSFYFIFKSNLCKWYFLYKY